MPVSMWTMDHVDFLEGLVRKHDLTNQEMATMMSRQFHVRITPQNVGALLSRMRRPTDQFYRNIPYRNRSRFLG